jgi:hypothetical protein
MRDTQKIERFNTPWTCRLLTLLSASKPPVIASEIAHGRSHTR